jgi:hypothetical protein
MVDVLKLFLVTNDLLNLEMLEVDSIGVLGCFTCVGEVEVEILKLWPYLGISINLECLGSFIASSICFTL